jgi:hypothetical protein
METCETFWRFTVTGLAVWRVCRFLLDVNEHTRSDDGFTSVEAEAPCGAGFWACRAVDLACWISIWMSPQTAICVTCGVAGAFLSWVAAGGVSRLIVREAWVVAAESLGTSCGDKLRARNG